MNDLRSMYLKVGSFLLIVFGLCVVFVLYYLHSRGFFERPFRFTMATADAASVRPGVPISYSGIPIGQVTGVEINSAGGVVIKAEVNNTDARWLRIDSKFILSKPFIGSSSIVVDSENLTTLPLPQNSRVLLQTVDPNQQISEVLAQAKTLLANLDHLTAPGGALSNTAQHVDTITGRMAGRYGVMEGVLGTPDKARAFQQSLTSAHDLLERLNRLTSRVDAMTQKTDHWLFAPGGVSDTSRQSLEQIRNLLAQVHGNLDQATVLLNNAVAISANVKGGTENLDTLRGEIDASVRKANGLLDQINRKWPFAQQPEIKLP